MVDEEPRKIGLTWPLIIVLAVAVPLIVVALMLGRNEGERADRLFHLAKAVTYGMVIVMVEVGLAFPIRQWRRKDMTGESHHYHDGTKTVEKWYYGQPARLPNVTNYNADPLGLPSFQRQMYAGLMAQGGNGGAGYIERTQPQQELIEADYDDEDAELEALPWSDKLPAEATDGRNDVPPPPRWTGEMRM